MLKKTHRIPIYITVIFTFISNGLIAQCPNNNTFLQNLTPAFAGDTSRISCVTAGDYITTNVSGGNIYVFSTCGYNGFDTEITLRNSSGTSWYAFNDNFCGLQSQITWTASFSGTVRLLIDKAPSCDHDTICQELFVTQLCQADAGTFTISKNGQSTSSPIYLCEGKDTINIQSNNDYVLPASDSGEVSELMYMVFNCPLTSSNPTLDTCFTGTYITDKDFIDMNPGTLNSGQRYYLIPATVDDGDNGSNPNSQVNLDNNGDQCYDLGNPIEVIYLSPIAFASNLDCDNKAVKVSIFGGSPEFTSGNYTIVNTGSGTISGLPVSHGGMLTISNLIRGDSYSFSVIDNNGCSSTFSGGPFSIPNAGQDTLLAICSNSGSFHLDTMINGNPDTNGRWYDPLGSLKGGVFNPTSSLTGKWMYVVDGFSVCQNDTSFVDISVDTLLEAGINSSTTICQYDSIQNLWLKLSASADSGGQWYMPNNIPFNGEINYAKNYVPNLRYKYRINEMSACPVDSSYHRIIMQKFPNAGRDSSIVLCSSEPVFNLTQTLSGNPDTNGVWFDPINNVHSKLFNSSIDSSGIYTYKVYGQSQCPDTSSKLSISIVQSANPGRDSSLSLCRSDSLFILLNLLSPSISAGIWINPNNDTILNNLIAPTIALSGAYRYFVAANSPCKDSSSYHNISLTSPPNPGIGGSFSFCNIDSVQTLFSLLNGNPDSNGIWKDTSGNAVNGTFNPNSDSSALLEYFIVGNSPCSDSSSFLNIQVSKAPNPGLSNAIAICSDTSSFPLLSVLNGNPDSNGSWTDQFSNAHNGIFNPNSDTSGFYTYELLGAGACSDTSQQVNIFVTQAPNPGKGDSLIFCSNDGSKFLGAYVDSSAQKPGFFKRPSGQNFSGLIYPSYDTSGLYLYTVTGIGVCKDSSARFLVNITPSVSAGSNGNYTACESDSLIPLITILGNNPDSGGTWRDGIGNITSAVFDPSTDSAQVFSYTISALSPCQDSTSFVTIGVSKNVSAGNDTSLTFCNNMPSVNLYALLSGNPDPGGAWLNPNQVPFNGLFNPSSGLDGIYKYKVNAQAPCMDKTSNLNIKTNTFYEAGISESHVVCENGPPFNFLDVLKGNPDLNGVWINPIDSTFDGISDNTLLISGKYHYVIYNEAPCAFDSSYVDLIVNNAPDAGLTSTHNLCETSQPFALFDKMSGNPDSNGIWYNPGGNIFGGIFDPSVHTEGLYNYVVSGLAPCANDTSSITVNVIIQPEAGIDQSLDVCYNGSIQLTTLLDESSDKNGVWYNQENELINGLFDAKVNESGFYLYVVLGNKYCPSDSMMANINISYPFDIYAGPDVYMVIGDKKPLKASSFDALEYEWKPSEGLSDSTIFNPKVFTEVTREYVVTGYDQNDCASSDTILVTVLPKIFIPNSFTPNGDGINDEWYVEGINEYPDHTVHVFSKNKIEVFTSSSKYERWDGSFNGQPSPQGNYYYVIEFGKNERFDTITGVITLLK